MVGFEMVGSDRIPRFERGELGAWSFRKSIEAGRAIGTSHRMTVAVQHDNCFLADQEVPFASDAIVEARFAPKQRAIAERPDYKLVPLRAGSMAFPELHEKASNAFSGPNETAPSQSGN